MVDRRYDTFSPRFCAAIIDGLILLPVGFLLDAAAEASLPLVAYTALLLDQAVMFAYSIYLHGTYGQTIGKWLMKVKVLSVDENRLTMKQAFLRDSIGLSLAVVYLIYAIPPVFSGVSPRSREFGESIPTLIWSVGLLTTALEVITMLTNAKRRALHDFIAGSVVVRLPRDKERGGPAN
jgi:uncharacterized RDD family membrane protein YckC